MNRAQGIKKRWEEEKNKDTNCITTAPLNRILELEYKRYKHLCWWTYEKSTPYSKWLLEEIDHVQD